MMICISLRHLIGIYFQSFKAPLHSDYFIKSLYLQLLHVKLEFHFFFVQNLGNQVMEWLVVLFS
jgi:hypothetical protein